MYLQVFEWLERSAYSEVELSDFILDLISLDWQGLFLKIRKRYTKAGNTMLLYLYIKKDDPGLNMKMVAFPVIYKLHKRMLKQIIR